MADIFVWSGATRTTNGTFDSDTGWTKGTGWTIASNVASKSAGTASDLEQNQTVTNAVTYRTSFTVTNRTAGAVFIRLGGTAGTSRTTNTTFEEDIVAGGGGDPKLEIVADASFDGDVDDVGVFANTGGTWEDAYTTLGRDYGVEAGFTPSTDFVYVRSTHVEGQIGGLPGDKNTTGTAVLSGTPTRILSVAGNDTGTTPGALTVGASITNDGNGNQVGFFEYIYAYGLNLTVEQDEINLGQGSNTSIDITLEQCTLTLNSTVSSDELVFGDAGASAHNRITLLDTDISQAGTTGPGMLIRNLKFVWDGGTASSSGPLTAMIKTIQASEVRIRNVDLSAHVGIVRSTAPAGESSSSVYLDRCDVNASVDYVDGGTWNQVGNRLLATHCDDGTDADPTFQLHYETNFGTVASDAARYRTGGASDGERTTPISWDCNSVLTSETYAALETPPIAAWTDGDGSTSHTFRVYIASGATQNNDDVWMDITGPNSTDTSSLGLRTSTRMAPLGTPTALTSDTLSSWTGSDVGTKQYMEVTYTPDKPGPVTCRVYLAKPTERISVDPKLHIDP